MKDKIGTPSKRWKKKIFEDNKSSFLHLISIFQKDHQEIKKGGGTIAIEKQHNKKRLTARERIDQLIDPGTKFFEIGIYAAWKMYTEYGSPAASGIITGIGIIEGNDCMIVANDATVKAGAYFELTLKKTLRAQKISMENNYMFRKPYSCNCKFGAIYR